MVARPDGAFFHLALRDEWDEAVARGGPYQRSTLGRSLAEQGYLHGSFSHQVQDVADRFYRGRSVVVLVIDPALLDVPLVVEHGEGTDERFPHVYGPLPLAAVVGTWPVEPGPDGTLDLSAALS